MSDSDKCPICEAPLPRPMIAEDTAEAKARLALLQDFEAIVLVPKLKHKYTRTISTKFLLKGPLSDVKRLVEAVLDTVVGSGRI